MVTIEELLRREESLKEAGIIGQPDGENKPKGRVEVIYDEIIAPGSPMRQMLDKIFMDGAVYDISETGTFTYNLRPHQVLSGTEEGIIRGMEDLLKEWKGLKGL